MDYIEALQKAQNALMRWDSLIDHQFSGSREAMSEMQKATFEGLDAIDAIEFVLLQAGVIAYE